jgi:hypothetical protein
MQDTILSDELRQLIHRVWAHGGRLMIEGDRISITTPQRPLPTELLARLRQHKAELMCYLRSIERPALYCFRISSDNEWHYMIAPPGYSADAVLEQCVAVFGRAEVTHFEAHPWRNRSAAHPPGPHACNGT